MKNSALKRTASDFAARPNNSGGGFQLPSTFGPMPMLEGPKELLSAASEMDLGFRIIKGQLDLVRSLAVDTTIVESMVNDVWNALGENNNVKKSVALIFHDGVWLRSDCTRISEKAYADIVRKKLNTIRTLLSELRGFSSTPGDDDLFTSAVRDDLRRKLSEILPYDYILNRATDQFRSTCKGLKAQCKELVNFISDEVRLSRSKTSKIISGNWTSPKLVPALLTSGGHELRFCPPAEMRRLRKGILERQRLILQAASSGECPAVEMLAAWAAFTRFDRQIEESVGLFVKANWRMVEQIVHQYNFTALDLVRSAADMGLVRAIYLFAPEKGYKFSTKAVQWIQQSILRDLNQQELIRMPEGTHRKLKSLRAALEEHPNASVESLMDATGLDFDEVENLMYLVAINKRTSLDSTFQEAGSDEVDGLHEILADTNNDFVNDLVEENVSSYIQEVLGDVLNRREMFVLGHRYGLGDETAKTLNDLSIMMKVSRERVRQIEVEAIKKIRNSEFADSLKEILE